MLDSIRQCTRCGLCKNQRPLLDKERECEFFWVGLSAKMSSERGEVPLSPSTNSGAMLDLAERRLGLGTGYRTNLVKCPPLDSKGKLRYPSNREMDNCFANLEEELDSLSPKVVLLLGGRVASSVERNYSVKLGKWSGFDYTHIRYGEKVFIPIHHPSYMHIYKRKQVDDYIDGIKAAIELALR